MLNTVSLTGVLRRVGAREFYVQQTNNAHLWLPVSYSDGFVLPGDGGEFQHVTVTCQIAGRFDQDSGERVAVLNAVKVEPASDANMPMEKAWRTFIPAGVPVDMYDPGVYGDIDENCSNKVEFAGFVIAKYLMPPEDSGMIDENRTLATLVQIDGDPSHSIPVRFYGKRTGIFNECMKIGAPIVVEGSFRVKVVQDRDAQLGVDGYFPVRLLPYVHASAPCVAGFNDIEELPSWIGTPHLKERDRSLAYPARPTNPALSHIN